MARRTSPTIMFSRRSSRSATAPARGPSSSAGSSEVSQTPPTAAPRATTPSPARSEARVDSATRLSQSPRLDSDVAIHSRRKGLMDSTLALVVLVEGDRKLTALGYPPEARSAAFISVFVLRHSHIFPGAPPGRPALPASHYCCGQRTAVRIHAPIGP